jgi:hypothetical protein
MKKERWVVFREEAKLVNLIDDVVERRGIDRSDFIREAIRKQLTELGFFPDPAKTAAEGCNENRKRGIEHGQAS